MSETSLTFYLVCHGSTLSRKEASGKPGAVQSARVEWIVEDILRTTRKNNIAGEKIRFGVAGLRGYPRGEAIPTKISGVGAKAALLRQTFKAAMGLYKP